jgi:3-phenylpropionate/cinnamic acid dioxygenase small subunit
MSEQMSVEDFLYHEAWLMDENRYEDWLDLFDEDCVYWIPSNEADYDPSQHTSILYGDRAMLQDHVSRLSEGKAFAQSPKSKLVRQVSNIRCDAENPLIVSANFIVVELRNRVQRIHAGRSDYELVVTDGALKIKMKKVLLLGMDEHQENITFLF